MADQAPGIFAILTQEELDFLRKGYVEEAMMASTREALGGMHPAAMGALAAMVDAIYRTDAGPEHPRNRERILITLLTGHHPAELAIHVYWGLMVGLTGDDIGQILLTTYGYNGVASYTVSLLTVKRTLEILKAQVAASRQAPPDQKPPLPHQSPAVVGALLQAFWGKV